MGTTRRYRDESDKKGSRKSKEDKRESGTLDPGLKTRSASTRPGQWHTAGGGAKSRSYRGK